MADLQAWENSVLGQHLDSDGVAQDAGQCSQVPISWAETIFPGTPWSDSLPAVGSDKGVNAWAGKSTQHFTWIENNHSDINQLPLPGDIMVFDATPAKGYGSTVKNPYGHTGVCKSASISGYTLIQQNAPSLGQGVNDTSYAWSFRPCLGWFRADAAAQPAPNPAPAPAAAPVMSNNVGRTLHLPKSISSWHVYNPDGPYDIPHATHVLDPAMYGGLDYPIVGDKGNGVYLIDTQMFGRVAICTSGTVATIS
jgi:hypothetical protein